MTIRRIGRRFCTQLGKVSHFVLTAYYTVAGITCVKTTTIYVKSCAVGLINEPRAEDVTNSHESFKANPQSSTLLNVADLRVPATATRHTENYATFRICAV